jgi:ActR/RegA family two-component response regulator
MTTTPRTVLIVEDDRLLSESYKGACRLAIYDLANAGLPVRAEIVQAHTFAEAMAAAAGAERLDFASVDLALDPSEQGPHNAQHAGGHETSGMHVLERLNGRTPPPIAVVISGETLIAYALDALQRFGAMHFFEKSRFSIEQYQAVVKAALLYLQARDTLDGIERDGAHPDDLADAERLWDAARLAAREADVAWQRFPSDLGLRIKAARAGPLL